MDSNIKLNITYLSENLLKIKLTVLLNLYYMILFSNLYTKSLIKICNKV